MTAGFVPPDAWTETAGQLKTSASVTLNSDGIGSIELSPSNANQRWVVTSVVVSTNQSATATVVPYATLALNTTDITQLSQGNQRGTTYSGNQNTFSGAMDVGPCDFLSVLFYPPPGSSQAVVGPAMPSWATQGWELIFDDEFTGTSLNTAVWNPNWFGSGITGPVNSAETAVYNSANVTVSGGYLNMLLTNTSSDGGAHPDTGSIVTTNPSDGRASGGFQFTYGAVEWRAWFPPDGAGTAIGNWPAVWLDGQSWPADGEFDVAEGLSGTAQWHIPTAPGNPGGGGPGTYYGWHQFGLEWDSTGLVTFYYDGTAVGSATVTNTAPMYLIMDNTQGSFGGPGTFPSTMLIDWVRVWQPAESPQLPALAGVIATAVITGTRYTRRN